MFRHHQEKKAYHDYQANLAAWQAHRGSVALVEDRRGAGEWKGRSQGFSIPVASIGGRSIRYRVGSSRGHFQQGAPIPTAIVSGTVYRCP